MCSLIPLTLPLCHPRARSSHPAPSPGTVPAGGICPTTTHTAGDFLAHPLVHKESITVLRDHGQHQCEPISLAVGGLDQCCIHFPAPCEGTECCCRDSSALRHL